MPHGDILPGKTVDHDFHPGHLRQERGGKQTDLHMEAESFRDGNWARHKCNTVFRPCQAAPQTEFRIFQLAGGLKNA